MRSPYGVYVPASGSFTSRLRCDSTGLVQEVYEVRVSGPRLSFSAAHFVVSQGHIEPLHGHNYSVSVTVTAEDTNADGMVVDFRALKRSVREVCQFLDHRVLLPGESADIHVRDSGPGLEVTVAEKRYLFPRDDCVVLPLATTTAEALAQFIATRLSVPEGVSLVTVCVTEDVGSTACYSPSTALLGE